MESLCRPIWGNMKKRDFLVAGVVLLAAVCLLFGWWMFAGGDCGEARVYLNGELYAVLPLDIDGEITVEGADGARNVIEVRNGRVRMQSSTCPNQTCVSCGWREPGEALLPDMRWIVCLPNRVSIELVGN